MKAMQEKEQAVAEPLYGFPGKHNFLFRFFFFLVFKCFFFFFGVLSEVTSLAFNISICIPK